MPERRGRKSRLSQADIADIRRRFDVKEKRLAIAFRYRISVSYVNMIGCGRRAKGR